MQLRSNPTLLSTAHQDQVILRVLLSHTGIELLPSFHLVDTIAAQATPHAHRRLLCIADHIAEWVDVVTYHNTIQHVVRSPMG